MNNRNTRQKMLIEKIMSKDKTHPTIAELYQKVQKCDPSVGQATVYRHVNRLCEEGKMQRIPSPVDVDHYDGNVSFHPHFVCKKCGRMSDIEDDSLQEYLKIIEQKEQLQVDHYHILLEGICSKCCKRSANEEVSL